MLGLKKMGIFPKLVVAAESSPLIDS